MTRQSIFGIDFNMKLDTHIKVLFDVWPHLSFHQQSQNTSKIQISYGTSCPYLIKVKKLIQNQMTDEIETMACGTYFLFVYAQG